MANPEQVAMLKRSVTEWNQWRKENPFIEIMLRRTDLSNTELSNADLSNADLSYTNLNNANLSNAILICSKLYCAELNSVCLSNTALINVNLCNVDLSYTDISNANLYGTDLSYSNFSNANLKNVNLSECKALNTNFANAILTGACIEDWHINSETNFEDVICDYIYLKYDYKTKAFTERRPSDESKIFNQGDFQRLIETSKETVDLIFSQGIDWQIFLNSLQQIQQDFTEENIAVSGIEKKSDSAFVIKLEVPQNANKATIEASFWQHYQPLLEAKDAQIKSLESEVESRRRDNTSLLKIIETLAAKDSNTYNFQGSQFGGGFAGNDYQGDVEH